MRGSPDALAGQFPDEDLPEGSVVDGELLTRDVDDAYDFVVVGSGAAGAVAAHTLARAGYSVAILEEGPWVRTRDFGTSVAGAFRTMMRDGGMQTLKGRAFMPMLQGRCVGGSTTVNSAIAWRTPEDVLDDWRERFGLGDAVTMDALAPHFDALERDLSVRPVQDEVLGENNRRFLEQARAMGFGGAPMRRYENGCRGSAMCLTGCRNGVKQGMNVSYVPWALGLGARIFTGCRVERVEIRGGRAVGVLGKASRAAVRLRARRGVVVAASTVQTPNLLRRSGIRSAALGEHFQAHPGLALVGRMDRRVDVTVGATQGAETAHFRKSERFKLETVSMPPDLAAARIPGVGTELAARMASFGDIAVWAAQIRAEAEGTVRWWFGADRVSFTMTENDMRATRKACGVVARMLFGAGALEVWPGIFGVPYVLRSIDEVKLIDEGPLDPRAYSFITTHLFGAARMGPDPRSSVVGLDFACHEAEALYVVDSSVFPTNLGVNPQHSIMALSRLAATRLADRARAQAVA